jgi:hypothetical protein
MKRILGLLISIAAVLCSGSAAVAAPVEFDLSGAVGWWFRSSDGNAAIPGPPTNGGPCGATGLGSSSPSSSENCFRYGFSPGSSVTVDITGSAVTMLGGTLIVDAVTSIVLDTIVLTMHHETTIAGGATGTLAGNSLFWSEPANVSTAGSIECAGPFCGLVALPEGESFPFHPTWETLTNTTPVSALVLGEWLLNVQHDSILGSATAVSSWSNAEDDGNRRQSAFTFGPTLLGNPVPEPASSVLVAAALGVLSLRSRKR